MPVGDRTADTAQRSMCLALSGLERDAFAASLAPHSEVTNASVRQVPHEDSIGEGKAKV